MDTPPPPAGPPCMRPRRPQPLPAVGDTVDTGGLRDLPAAQPGPAQPRPQRPPAALRELGMHHPMSGSLWERGGGLPCVRGRSPSGVSGPAGATGGERAGGCGGAAGGLSALLSTGSGSRRVPSGTPREGCGGRDTRGAGSGVHTHGRGSGQVRVQVAQGHAPARLECPHLCMGHMQACA